MPAPLLVPILGYSALAGGVAAGVPAAAGQNEGLAKLLRLDPKARAEGETFDRTTGRVKNYDFGDFLLSSLLGQDEAAINAEAQKRSDTQLTNEYRGTTQRLRNELNARGLSNPEILQMLKPQRFENADQYAENLKSVGQHINEFSKAQAAGLDTSMLTKNGGLLTQGVVEGAIFKKQEKDRQRLEHKGDTRYNDEIAHRNTVQEQANQLSRDTLDLNAHNADENRRFQMYQLDRAASEKAADRRDNRDLMMLQMRERSLDRAYARERDERAEARASRDKRTAMLMQMVQGLSKLGYGMAI